MSAARILITRSRHQASALAERLSALGFEPILIPTIEFTEPTTFAPLDAALAHLDTFHWLLFTSVNAVEAFHLRLTGEATELGAPGPDLRSRVVLPPALLTAAIGPATAQALTAMGLHPDLIPPQAVAESLTKALLPHALQPNGTATRFLLIRAEQARDHLPDTLRAAGANITIVPAYRTVIPAGSIPAIQHLFSTPFNYPHAITFTSSSTANNLLALLEAANLTLPASIPRISIGPITSQTLRELGLPPHAEAAEPTITSLVEILVKSLNLRNPV